MTTTTTAATHHHQHQQNQHQSRRPDWDSTTSFGVLGTSPTPLSKQRSLLNSHAALTDPRNASSSPSQQQNNKPKRTFQQELMLLTQQDPSVELKLAGTYVPLRLVRLTEEVRFRESCRRIALARARLEDLRDFKLLMRREHIFAEEEEERVEIEVEQERLFGVMKYWIEFRTVLIIKTIALGEEETAKRSIIDDEYRVISAGSLSSLSKELQFLCVQDTERFALHRQEEDAFAVLVRQYMERNAYFEAKANLARTQMRALACALSCWAIDNALRGENTVWMLRPEMQQSPIVSMRSLTFGQGKWAKGR